eukprot:8469711-Pyramimonas_sp.AAC.1
MDMGTGCRTPEGPRGGAPVRAGAPIRQHAPAARSILPVDMCIVRLSHQGWGGGQGHRHFACGRFARRWRTGDAGEGVQG